MVGVKVVGAAAAGAAEVKSAKAMAKRVIARSSYSSSRQCYAVRPIFSISARNVLAASIKCTDAQSVRSAEVTIA